jgi:alkylation response protein AidB-like acyl-CoA dehydrogenase
VVSADLERAVRYLRKRRRMYGIPAKDQRTLRRLWPSVTLLAAYREMSRREAERRTQIRLRRTRDPQIGHGYM